MSATPRTYRQRQRVRLKRLEAFLQFFVHNAPIIKVETTGILTWWELRYMAEDLCRKEHR